MQDPPDGGEDAGGDAGACGLDGTSCTSPSQCCSLQCDPLGRCFSAIPETGECQSSTECYAGQTCTFPDDSGVGQCLPGCRYVSQACKPGVADCCGNDLCVDRDGSTCATGQSGCLCVYPR
ncbi:MAG TPA: hypothetical protein VND93_15830 [Myxococcales bacterium]|nr:hypothetical protein [Myxococcales bacterium]